MLAKNRYRRPFCLSLLVLFLIALATFANSVSFTTGPAETEVGGVKQGTISCSGVVVCDKDKLKTTKLSVLAAPKKGGPVYEVKVTLPKAQQDPDDQTKERGKFAAEVTSGKANPKLPNGEYDVWAIADIGGTKYATAPTVVTVTNGAGSHDGQGTITCTTGVAAKLKVSASGAYTITGTGDGWKRAAVKFYLTPVDGGPLPELDGNPQPADVKAATGTWSVTDAPTAAGKYKVIAVLSISHPEYEGKLFTSGWQPVTVDP